MQTKYIQEEITAIADPEWFKDHYSPLEVIKTNTPYILSYGGRNIGKTFAWLILILATWQLKDYKSVIMRRMAETLKTSKASQMFTKVFNSGIVPNKKEYAGISYRTGMWRGYWEDDKGKKIYDEPFCYSFALSSAIEMNKGVSDIEHLGIILFDEALTADNSLTDEWMRFQNAMSTLIRENSQACCVLCANTVSWVAPYFREFGIQDVRKIKQGTIKVFKCLDETAVTLEYCNDVIVNRKKKITDKRFFGFKTGTSDMIRQGGWEIHSYQHLTREMIEDRHRELITRDIYIAHENEILCLELYVMDDFGPLVNVRPADNFDLGKVIYVVGDHTDPRYHHRPNPSNKIDKLIWTLYHNNRFYYADNLCGEIVKKFLAEYHM